MVPGVAWGGTFERIMGGATDWLADVVMAGLIASILVGIVLAVLTRVWPGFIAGLNRVARLVGLTINLRTCVYGILISGIGLVVAVSVRTGVV